MQRDEVCLSNNFYPAQSHIDVNFFFFFIDGIVGNLQLMYLGFILFVIAGYITHLYGQFSTFLNKSLLRKIGVCGAEKYLLLFVTSENGNDRQLCVLD